MIARNKASFPVLSLLPSRGIAVIVLGATLAITGCSKPVEKVEEIRPVRTVRLTADKVDMVVEFPGEVRARVESRLGFRVGGKIVSRKVDIGTQVKSGQVLMQLDPQDFRLAQAQANAGLRAAESSRDLASAEYKRYKDLREKNFVSQAVLDSKETAFKAAQASYEQALAAFRNQSNQAGYTTLVSDVDGVVTGVDAEAGQVVAAGTPVVRVAKAGDKEIVISIPEDKVDTLKQLGDVRVRIWAKPDENMPGKLRELSPVADPTTRTYTAKIAIPASDDVKLGMTAYVAFTSKSDTPAIKLPLTALLQDKSSTAVWVVKNGAVYLVPVKVGGATGNNVVIVGGVGPGQIVVVAGVNLLKPGQKVKILDEDSSVRNDTRVASAEPANSEGAMRGVAK